MKMSKHYSKYPKIGVTVDKSNATEESSSEGTRPVEYIDKDVQVSNDGSVDFSDVTYPKVDNNLNTKINKTLSLDQHVDQVLDFVEQKEGLTIQEIENSQIGSMTKDHIRHAIHILIYKGKFLINKEHKLVLRRNK